MTYVVTESCINCKHTTCVVVCPTETFREGPNFLVIDPVSCIDCNICPAECPEEAIFFEDNVPTEQIKFIKINAELSQSWPLISESKAPMNNYDKWRNVLEETDFLIKEIVSD